MTDYEILYVALTLMFARNGMTQAEAIAYIRAHPDFQYRTAAGL